jgi:transposase
MDDMNERQVQVPGFVRQRVMHLGQQGERWLAAPRIARRGIESRERLGRHRWVVERTLSWLNRFRRLKVRYERRADIHHAFLSLGCALVCWRALMQGEA